MGIGRVTINWSGFAGAPGYTNLFFDEVGVFGPVTQAAADEMSDRVDTWLNAWFPSIPSGVVLGVDPSVADIDQLTGVIEQFLVTTPDSPEGGTGSGGYSAAAGACVNWNTPFVVNGRRVRGRTFMVPLAGSALQSNGSIDDTRLTAMRNASTTLATPTALTSLIVYTRPSGPGASDGTFHTVNSATINDKTAILRSRRD